MKAVRDACRLQPNALDVNVGDQIEELDEIIRGTDGREYFSKTFVTEGLRTLLTQGIARLAGKSSDAVFHLKQAMGGGKTHSLVCFGLLAGDRELRKELIGDIPYVEDFGSARIAAFNGRNLPQSYFWGEIARQLGGEALFAEYWSAGPKAPDRAAWLQLFALAEGPVLILLDELPPYFQYYNTQALGKGTVADVVTTAFANLLVAARDKADVCICVSDLNAAYGKGGDLIQSALGNAAQELGRMEVSVTPVNLESSEIYDILRKRLFASLPDSSEIDAIADAYARKLKEATRAKAVQRGAEALAGEIGQTYPFHPAFKHIVALFKENERFKQTRGLMELVSRLLKSVWSSSETVFLIGAQHFDLSISEVREKIAEISEMREVIAKDLWDAGGGAHAQSIDAELGGCRAQQAGTLLLLSSLSTAVNAVKGLSEEELCEILVDPLHGPGDFKPAFELLHKDAWYVHRQQDGDGGAGRYYFDRQENLTKKLQVYADKAPQNRVDDLIRHRLEEMFRPVSKDAYETVKPLPEIDEARAALNSRRALLIINPDGKMPPHAVESFFQSLANKNNLLVLTGEKSSMANVENRARHLLAACKADQELPPAHPQRGELEAKKNQFSQDLQSTILSIFDSLVIPKAKAGKPVLKSKPLDGTYPPNQPYRGEDQVIKTLASDPVKLYADPVKNFDAVKSEIEDKVFGQQDVLSKTALVDGMRTNPAVSWLPPGGLDKVIAEACRNGQWEKLANGSISRHPQPKTTKVQISAETGGDDLGKVRLKVEAVNAGPRPRIHFAEDGPVSESSPVLTEEVLETAALRVQFLAVDPDGKHPTGAPAQWENSLVIRADFDDAARTVSLSVVPRGTIRFTLDGQEPRLGEPYAGTPVQIGDEETTVAVFAECDGLENRRSFTYPAAGGKGIVIDRARPAVLATKSAAKSVDTSREVHDALSAARDRGIQFQNAVLGCGGMSIYFSEVTVDASQLEDGLKFLRSIAGDDADAQLKFRKALFRTGGDLETFCAKLGIAINEDEVEQ